MSTLQRHRPRNNRERTELVRQFSTFDPAAIDKGAAETIQTWLSPALESWSAAETAHGAAMAGFEAARMAFATSDANWNDTVDRLSWSLRGPDGRPISLTELVKQNLSQLVRQAPDRKVRDGEDLLGAIDLGKATGEAALVASLREQTAALHRNLAQLGERERARFEAVAALAAADQNLDRATALTARALDTRCGAGAARRYLPTFASIRKPVVTKAKAPTMPETPETPVATVAAAEPAKTQPSA